MAIPLSSRLRTILRPIQGRTFPTLSRRSSTIVDCRSDTVTLPTPAMLQSISISRLGDDVMGEDATVTLLERTVAEIFGKAAGLFVPTGTMANLCSLISHGASHDAPECIIGSRSHMNIYEGGHAAMHASMHLRQLEEISSPSSPPDTLATLDFDDIADAIRVDDPHYPTTAMVSIENTHNVLGGVPVPPAYFSNLRTALDTMCAASGVLHKVPVHIDGARIFHACEALESCPSVLTEHADSVSVCLSKGLGAPAGTVLVGSEDFISRARRARKRLGGGMRQSGVLAAMGIFALEHHVERLSEDRERAQRFSDVLVREGGFILPYGPVRTNLAFFCLPKEVFPMEIADDWTGDEASRNVIEDVLDDLKERHGVLVGGGYGRGGRVIRAAFHKDVDDEGLEKAMKGLLDVANCWKGGEKKSM
uniref:Aromatic amino acid beta-eliminating lyase/threonine aldolase domain-containing protein n=1 Tax=Corethron hystrix TaxID=216773 RepID=A0A7S1BWD0_9STRA